MKKKIKNLVVASLISALITLSILIFKVPTGFNNGYIHIGDVFIYIAGALLPWNYAFFAAAIGAGLADVLSGGIIWIIPTIIIKGITTLLFTSKNRNIINKRNIIALLLSGIFGVLGYYLYGVLITGNFITPLITLAMEIVQPIISGIIFIIIGLSLDKINFKDKF